MGVKYFPFAPGVPFKEYSGKLKYIYTDNGFNKAFIEKTVNVICNKGFIENLLCLSLIKSLKLKNEGIKINFIADNKFDHLYYLAGKYQKSIWDIPKSLLNNYNTPLFFDKDFKNTFLNATYCYDSTINYKGEILYNKNYQLTLKKIFFNSPFSWKDHYLINFNWLNTEKLKKSAKTKNISLDSNFVLIFPGKTGLSVHNDSCLDWNLYEIKEFVSLCSSINKKVVIMSPNPQLYTGLNVLFPDFTVENIVYLIGRTEMILSKDPDYLQAGFLIGKEDVKIASCRNYGPTSSLRLFKFLKNRIRPLYSERLSTMEAFDFLRSKVFLKKE